jgi:hypothetical protein
LPSATQQRRDKQRSATSERDTQHSDWNLLCKKRQGIIFYLLVFHPLDWSSGWDLEKRQFGMDISGSTKGDLSYVCLVKLDEHCYLTRNFYIRKIKINIWQNFNELCHLIFFFFL